MRQWRFYKDRVLWKSQLDNSMDITVYLNKIYSSTLRKKVLWSREFGTLQGFTV